MAQTHQINTKDQREFKVIVLTGVENLTVEAQHALRRTMEKYIATCRLILISQSLSKVTEAIHSRCLCIRCPAPTHDEITAVLSKMAELQCLTAPESLLKKIAVKSQRNLRRAILMLETCFVQCETGHSLTPNEKIVEPDWLVHLKEIAKRIVENQSIQSLQVCLKSIKYDLATIYHLSLI